MVYQQLSPVKSQQANTHKLLYAVPVWRTVSITLLAFIADLLAIPFVLRAKPEITEPELQQLLPSAIARWNRRALKLDFLQKDEAQKASDLLLKLIIAGAIILVISKRVRRNFIDVSSFMLLRMQRHTRYTAFHL